MKAGIRDRLCLEDMKSKIRLRHVTGVQMQAQSDPLAYLDSVVMCSLDYGAGREFKPTKKREELNLSAC